MPIQYAVFDWNRTLFEPPTDEGLNKAIAYAVLDDTKKAVKRGKFWRVWSVAKLLMAKKHIQKRLDEYKAGKRHLKEVYEPFNRWVIRGKPYELIMDTFEQYSSKHFHLVDERMLEPLRNFRQRGGRSGILSVSQMYVNVCNT